VKGEDPTQEMNVALRRAESVAKPVSTEGSLVQAQHSSFNKYMAK